MRGAAIAALGCVAIAMLGAACASSRPPPAPPMKAPDHPSHASELALGTAESVGMRSEELVALTKWIDETSVPIFSLLISRDDKLVYELYTSSIERDDAHYVMSVTKSVLSALIGVAIDRNLISGPAASVSDLLPRAVFPSDADVARFKGVTLKQVLGMAAIDAPDPPRTQEPRAVARYQRFWRAPNRVAFVLGEPLLKEGFQYNDATPTLASGALQYRTGKTALEFAEEALFRPMGFRNYEWMHQDASGIDNGGYGLRLRPIDMQKFGLLYLHHGVYDGQRLISRAWVDRSFEPYNRSAADRVQPDYGWFWWAASYGEGWSAHVAKGWKGQRIAVMPEKNIVITMTACIEDGTEQELFDQIVEKVVKPSVEHGGDGNGGAASSELAALLMRARRTERKSDWIQYRMVPSSTPKAKRKPFVASPTPTAL